MCLARGGGRSIGKLAPAASTTAKTKRLCLFITRYSKSENRRRQRQARAAFRKLISRVEWILEAACELAEEVLERHEGLFGQRPEVLAADKGFCPAQEKYEDLQGRVGTLAIPRRMRDLADAVMQMWRSFRAGIERTISGLKRVCSIITGFWFPRSAWEPLSFRCSASRVSQSVGASAFPRGSVGTRAVSCCQTR